MKNIKSTLTSASILTFLMLLGYQVNAQTTGQKIGTNPTIKEASAVLELEAANKGVLMPRVALASILDASTVPSPAKYLTVFNTANTTTGTNDVTEGYYYWDGAKWVKLATLTDEPWYNQATNAGATANTQSIYQMGNVAVQKILNLSGTALDVSGAARIGTNTTGAVGVNSFAGGTNNMASVDNAVSFGVDNQSTGLQSMTWGGNPSHSLLKNNIASGVASTAFGYGNRATSYGATTWGTQNQATNPQATAFGASNIASGFWSTAFGQRNLAVGNNSTVFGTDNEADGNSATAIGNFNIASGANELVIGAYNAITTASTALLQVGNGTTATTRANALTILKNGNIGTDIAIAPTEKLHIGSGKVKVTDLYTTNATAADDKFVVTAADGILKTIANTGAAIRTVLFSSTTALKTAAITDETILVDATGGLITITLPDATTVKGKKYNVKKIDASANGVNVIATAGTIDGNAAATGVTGALAWQGWVFQSDGTNWYIISRI